MNNDNGAVLALALELQHAAKLLRGVAQYGAAITDDGEFYDLEDEAERMDELRERVLKEAV